jgi:hypothetical protein
LQIVFSKLSKIQNGTRSQPENRLFTLKATGEKESFDLPVTKDMINGFDDIDYLQNIKEEVLATKSILTEIAVT